MAALKEDILLSVAHVKNKKCDGTLCLLSERIAWMPSGKSSLTISNYYTDIKAQKISPDTKDKVQLQIVLQSPGAHTFHFNNPGGKDAQVKDRDAVKDLLLEMLNQFKKQLNHDLEEKNRMLQDDPHLFQLYKSLVVSGILTADEFWSNRTNRPKVGEISKQEIGVSPGFFADVEQVEGATGVRYNLTVEIIENIFTMYPAVERKHNEYVPEKLTEAEFWIEFFKSHYFHRDRMDINDQELFAGCLEDDERKLKRDSSVPLSKNKGIQALFDFNPDESYASTEQPKPESFNTANLTLIRRLNRYSTLILKSTDNSNNNGLKLKETSEPMESAEGTKRKLCDSTSTSAIVGRPLKLMKTEAYKHGPMPVVADTYNTTNELMEAARVFAHDVMAWKPTPVDQLMSSNAGLSVIFELSPGGILMQDASDMVNNDAVPRELLTELKSMYSGMGELLRHFWSCFPITCKELEEKASRMEECLKKFQMTKIPAFIEKLAPYHVKVDPTSHMNVILEKAFSKYSNWSLKKTTKRL